MQHTSHDTPKRLEQALRAAHNDNLLSLHEQIGLLKSTVNEAHIFITAGNILQAAAVLTQLYYDCDEMQKRIIAIAERS